MHLTLELERVLQLVTSHHLDYRTVTCRQPKRANSLWERACTTNVNHLTVNSHSLMLRSQEYFPQCSFRLYAVTELYLHTQQLVVDRIFHFGVLKFDEAAQQVGKIAASPNPLDCLYHADPIGLGS